MADNILTKDRADANLDIAAKEIGGVKFPRNVLTDPSGNDLTPLTDAALRATPVPVSGGLTDSELRASALSVNVPGVATDAVVQEISKLNETMLYMLSSILEKMPRVDAADREIVSIESGSVGISANQTLATLSDQTNIGGRSAAHMTFAMANVGALHIYDKIIVS